MNKKVFAWAAAGFLILLGLGLFSLVFLSYPTLKAFLDKLTSDGNFNSLKPWNAIVFKGIFAACGVVCFLMAALSFFRRWRLLAGFFRELWMSFRRSFTGWRFSLEGLGTLAVVLLIMILAVIFRLERIYSPLHHDEAYTFVAFGQSLFTALTDYHLPNNHVFHTILVYFSTRLFGTAPWVVRLPAFIAGVLLVPAVYWLGKRLYNRWTGLAAGCLVAWFPALISYANNARGYTLVALFTVIILALGDIVRREKNLFAWVLISLFSALGFFTVPVMAFPFGILFVWLFLENQFGDVRHSIDPKPSYTSRREFLYYWLGSGFGAAVLTLLFYLPILIFSGSQRLLGNDFVAPLPWSALIGTLMDRFGDTWAEWSYRVPMIFLILLGAGFLLALLLHRKITSHRVPLQVAALLWIVILLFIQRPNAWSKVWVFLQPLMLLWAAAGIVGLLDRIPLHLPRQFSLNYAAMGALLVAGIIHATQILPDLPSAWAAKGDEEKAVLYIQGRLVPQDLILVAPTDDAAVWYYSILHRIPNSYFERSRTDFESAYVIVNTAESQTIASVVAGRGPLDSRLDLNSARFLETFGSLEIFEVPVAQE